MFCTQCGNEVEQYARFCSKCGQDVSESLVVLPPAPPKRIERDMDLHITILGWLLIGSGILTAIFGFIVLFASQILERLPPEVASEIPVGMVHFAAWLTSVVGLSILALAAGTTGAGVGLLQYRNWARTTAIVMSVLLLFHFPIGTAIGVYAFWVLLSEEGQRYYKSRAESAAPVS